MWKVPFFDLNFGPEEQAAAAEVVAGRWLTAGPRIERFEEEFAALCGESIQAAAVSSCTGALHLALLALGVGPGDEVLLPALSFVAGLNVTVLTGAKPVLLDCTSSQDWNVDPEEIRKKISPRTKAVMIVHFAGMPCRMDEIVSICEEAGVALVEDAAHAVGSYYKGRHLGTFGAYGCFSFFSNKNLAVGEGGMITSRDPRLAERVRLMRSHGIDRPTIDRYRGKSQSYDVTITGLNYRMDEIRAALGSVQLTRLREANLRRGELSRAYKEALRDLPVETPWTCTPEGSQSSHHIFPILVVSREVRAGLICHLKGLRVQTSIHYPSYRDFTAYGGHDFDPTPVADDISSRVVTLPLYPGMSDSDQALVMEGLRSYFLSHQEKEAAKT